ncbi:MAG TPA: thiamine pyrophosphate-requiring protein [Stellaceae bacterium]|nr:thiamine pyrophosphate-requiring protein [Stellaceae bacterium]
MGAQKTIAVETVAEAYLTLLAERGIEYLFANGGTDFAPMNEALAAIAAKGTTPRLKVVTVAHENVAACMAHGYYLMTGRPQMVMFHVNVGTANGINALADAARDHVPLIFTAGRNPITEQGMRGSRDTGIHWGQEMFDQAGMVRELCKWDYELRNGEQLEAVVDRAIEIATSEPCGPVYLSLPREVMSAPMKSFSFAATPRRAYGTIPGATPDQIARAADLLAASKRPLVFARENARVAANAEALLSFVDRFAMPLVEYRSIANSIPTDHPMHLGYDPLPHLREADVILNIETDVPWIPTVHGGPAEDCKIIHLGVDPLFSRLPIRSFPSDVVVTGAPRAVLPQLAAAIGDRIGKSELTQRRARIAALRARADAEAAAALARVRDARPIHPAWAAHCIDAAKGDDAIVVNEYSLILRQANFRKPRTYLGTPGAGGLGWGVGAAIGAKLAAPDRLVIATLGDGAYMFGNPTAGHQVARTLGLPVLFIVFNNAMWEEVEGSALRVFPDGHAARSNRMPVADLGPAARYEHMMDIYGGHGECVETPEALPGALERAIHAVMVEKRQALLNLVVGPRGAAP